VEERTPKFDIVGGFSSLYFLCSHRREWGEGKKAPRREEKRHEREGKEAKKGK
jgi:hypothetical protein